MFTRITSAVLLVFGLVAVALVFWDYVPGEPEAVWEPAWLHYTSLAGLLSWFALMAGVLTLLIWRRGWPLLYWLAILALVMGSTTRLLTYRASGEPFTFAEPQTVLSLAIATAFLWIVVGFAFLTRSREFFIPSKLR